jgi:hypothetical protein
VEADSLTATRPSLLELFGAIVTVPNEADMDDGWRTHVFDAAVVVSARDGIVKKSFAAAEQHGHDRQMQFINEPCAEVLPNGGCTSSHQNIAAVCNFERGAQSCVDPAVDEMEGGSSLQFDRWTRVVREDEDRVMEGWVLSPPADPLTRLPRAAYRAEHVPTHDGGSNANCSLREELIV